MFDAKQFVDLSRSILNTEGLDEARFRTISSRSLYAVFLIAREELQQRGCKVKATPDYFSQEHDRVRREFKVGGKFRHDGVSSRLTALYALRWRADYNPEKAMTIEDAKQALAYADYVLGTFAESLFKNPPSAS